MSTITTSDAIKLVDAHNTFYTFFVPIFFQQGKCIGEARFFFFSQIFTFCLYIAKKKERHHFVTDRAEIKDRNKRKSCSNPLFTLIGNFAVIFYSFKPKNSQFKLYNGKFPKKSITLYFPLNFVHKILSIYLFSAS